VVWVLPPSAPFYHPVKSDSLVGGTGLPPLQGSHHHASEPQGTCRHRHPLCSKIHLIQLSHKSLRARPSSLAYSNLCCGSETFTINVGKFQSCKGCCVSLKIWSRKWRDDDHSIQILVSIQVYVWNEGRMTAAWEWFFHDLKSRASSLIFGKQAFSGDFRMRVNGVFSHFIFRALIIRNKQKVLLFFTLF